MARCKLDLQHPKFRTLLGRDPDVEAGLLELQAKVALDHRASGFFSQPMPRFPDYQNRIWKWDFAPASIHTSTRKGWRLFAYVPDPRAIEPIPATAFYFYPRSQAPQGNPPKHLARMLRSFLRENTADGAVSADRYRRQEIGDGVSISICLVCFATVARSSTASDLDREESLHSCGGIGQG